MPFIVLYDANVLVGNSQRDLLIRTARAGLVQASWTDRILDEVTAAIQKGRPDIAADKLARLRELMVKAVPRRSGYRLRVADGGHGTAGP
jgi:hypothetical protein